MLAVGLSLLRRRWPLPIALVVTGLGAISATSAGAGLLGTSVSLATRKVMWQIALIALVSIGAGQVFPYVQPQPAEDSWWVTLVVGVAFTVAMLAWGLYIGSRRELLWTLRDQVHRAESEQDLRVEQGRSNERARIAREMHDVLAHRISLITMHAGALAYRTDLSAEQVRADRRADPGEVARSARRSASGPREAAATSPTCRTGRQPTFGDVGSLILEAEESGMSVRYDDSVRLAPDMPEQVGRTTYRIVQEGLDQRPQARGRCHGAGPHHRLPDDGGHPHPQSRPHACRCRSRS
ncbi:MAG: histidine kinase dimerization/phosphoacceptor domain-containing protein [Candidatus Limnocylindrales bacterium]